MRKFKLVICYDDYLNSVKYYLLNSRKCQTELIFSRYTVPINVLFIIIVNYFLHSNHQSNAYVIKTIIYEVFCVSILIFGFNSYYRSKKKSIDKQKAEGTLNYDNNIILKFDNESMYEITPNNEKKTEYSSIEKVAKIKPGILIVTPVTAYILPATAFSEKEEEKEFFDFLKSSVHTSKNTK